MKRNALVRVCLWTFVSFLLIAALYGALEPSLSRTSAESAAGGTDLISGLVQPVIDAVLPPADTFSGTPETTTLTAAQTDAVTDISVSWLSGHVRVTVHDGDTLYFAESAASGRISGDNRLQYTLQGGKLSIDYTESNFLSFLQNRQAKQLELFIPRGLALETLSVENVSSTVRIEGVSAWSLRVTSVSGAVSVSGASAQGFSSELVSASIDVTGSFDEVDMDGVSGSQALRLTAPPHSVRISSVSGGLNVYLSKDIGYTASLESVSGRLTAADADTADRKSASYGDGSASIRLETVSGSAGVHYDPSLDPATGPEASASPGASKAPESREPVPSSQRSF